MWDMTRPQIVKTSLFTLLALASLAASGCRGGRRRENPQAWAYKGELAAPATLVIRNTLGEIDVEPATGNTVEVTASTSWSRGNPERDLKFQAVTEGNTLTICAIWTRGECSARNYSSDAKTDGMHVQWGNKTNASVHFVVKVPAGVRVDASTVSGDVTVRAAAPVKVRSINGDIKVGTSVGPVNAEAVSGDVDVRMTTVGDTGAIRAVTMNGDAVAWVPDIASGAIEASTIHGDIGLDFGSYVESGGPVGRAYRTVLGGGERSYTVKSVNGSAWLRMINADGSVNTGGREARRDRSRATIIEPRKLP
jgi:hypothetical protein